MKLFRHLIILLLALAPICVFSGNISDLQPGQWVQLSDTRLQEENPCPTDDCAYSANIGFEGIMSLWSGGAFDSRQNRLIVWGGGHLGYFGNDAYAFDLDQTDTGEWVSLIAPANEAATEAEWLAGQYSDGSPISRHTYNHLVFVTSQNAFITTGGSAFSPIGSRGDGRFWKLDFDNPTVEWSEASPSESGPTQGYSAYNATTDTVYYHHSSGGRFYKYDPSTDTHTYLTQKPLAIYATAAIDTARNRMLVVGGYSAPQAFYWDLNEATPTSTDLMNNPSFNNDSGFALADDGQFGLDYDPVNDKFVAWRGGKTVYVIDPVTFAVSTYTPVSGDDPGAELSLGTYGRFRYAPSIGGFILANGVDKDVFLFKLNDSSTSPPPGLLLDASPAQVAEGGETTVTWSASNADSCVASGSWSGAQLVSGELTFNNLQSNQSYALSCSGNGGTIARTVEVVVDSASPAPTLNLSADPVEVTYNDETTLTWVTTNVDSCMATGGWSGARDANGTESSGALVADTMFTLECSGSGGTISRSAAVTVSPDSSPSIILSATPNPVSTGGSTTVNWMTNGYSSCLKTGGWSGVADLSGSAEAGPFTVNTSLGLSCSDSINGSLARDILIEVSDTPTADWTARSTAPGVLMATRFDTQEEVDNWIHLDGSKENVKWDQQNAASGNGSLRMDILKTDGANSGNWRRWLSDDQREFVEGDAFYVSYRQYTPHYYARHVFNGGGWKQSIISRNAYEMNGELQSCNNGTDCGSNQLNEVVLNNNLYRGIVQGYNRNSNGAYPSWEVFANTACSGTDFIMQNAVDHGLQDIGTPCENARAQYGGLYSYGARTGEPDPLTGAFIYMPDEWMTFKVYVKLGAQGTGTENSHVKVWAAKDGENFELIIDRDDIDLGNGPAHNTLWLLPYDTGKQPNPGREDTYTLYDEVIVSLNDIAAPGQATPVDPEDPPVTADSEDMCMPIMIGDGKMAYICL